MLEKLRKDSYVIGAVIGIVVPAVLFAILYGIFAIIVKINPDIILNNPDIVKTLIPKFILIAMIPNVIILRHYLLKLAYDKTGRGILIATFALAILFVFIQFTL